MRIALVHELLTMRGGAERVLRILADMFPDAPIYTLLYNEKKLGTWFPKERIRTSALQPTFPFPLSPFHFNHHLYLNKFPAAVEAWDFSEFDLVLSTSSAFVHGIITNSAPKHLCYVHSPARYLWDRTHDVVREASYGLFGPLRKRYLEKTFHKLRMWDSEAADRPDMLLAASKAVQRRVELYWRRTSDVVYPPIDDFWFTPPLPPLHREAEPGGGVRAERAGRGHYLVASSLVKYKRIDLAIQACNASKKYLKIVGEGPDQRRLQSLAGPTVEFYGWRQSDELKDLITAAKAVLFPGDEDFGLVPLEAMACGTPVIAFRSGGALETMVEGETGEFFDQPTADSLQMAMQNLEQKKYSNETLIGQAKKFSRQKFEAGILSAIEKLQNS